jgi:hypothetical protein
MVNSLVIVESPAKCKKIEGYLGSGYKVIASFGHLRTINGREAIDVSNNFHTSYSIIQESLKLKQIEKSEWKIEPNIDEKGFKKSIELDGYKFVYIDYIGKIHDLRPRDSIPSFNNFSKKSEKELYQLLIKALKNHHRLLHLQATDQIKNHQLLDQEKM